MAEDNTEKVKTDLKSWVQLDDEERALRAQIKALQERKHRLSENILAFMRDNEVDNFALQGNALGSISRSVRTSRPPLRRQNIRTQLLIQFADQPQRVAEALRAIEGIPEGAEDMSMGGTQRELLVRRLPREKKTVTV